MCAGRLHGYMCAAGSCIWKEKVDTGKEKRMKRAGIWFWMLLKRQLKKPSLYIVIICMVVCCFVIRSVASGFTVNLAVGIMNEDTGEKQAERRSSETRLFGVFWPSGVFDRQAFLTDQMSIIRLTYINTENAVKRPRFLRLFCVDRFRVRSRLTLYRQSRRVPSSLLL